MNMEQIQDIIKIFESSSVAKMELEINDMKIKLEKPTAQEVIVQPMIAQPITNMPSVKEEVSEVVEEVVGTWIKSPIVGTFYSSRAKGSTPFVEIGQHVKKGDILCIIEAMKVMNEIHSPVDGVIQAILPTNESMVEFDQDLIRIGE